MQQDKKCDTCRSFKVHASHNVYFTNKGAKEKGVMSPQLFSTTFFLLAIGEKNRGKFFSFGDISFKPQKSCRLVARSPIQRILMAF